jgi:hypothetical protein
MDTVARPAARLSVRQVGERRRGATIIEKPEPSSANTLSEEAVRALPDSMRRAIDSRTVARSAMGVSISNTACAAAATRSALCRSVTSRKQTTNLSRRLSGAWRIAISAGNILPSLHTPQDSCAARSVSLSPKVRRQGLQRLCDGFVLRDLWNQQIDAPADDFSGVKILGLGVRPGPPGV